VKVKNGDLREMQFQHLWQLAYLTMAEAAWYGDDAEKARTAYGSQYRGDLEKLAPEDRKSVEEVLRTPASKIHEHKIPATPRKPSRQVDHEGVRKELSRVKRCLFK
jgi:hypothetical protein